MSMVSKARLTSDGHRHRIVCVDDETQVLEGLSLQLGRRYEVLTALSGAEALEIPQREDHISVLISYMRMPRMDGATLLAKARSILPHAARILLTGQTDLRSAIAAVNAPRGLRSSHLRQTACNMMTVDLACNRLQTASTTHGGRRGQLRR